MRINMLLHSAAMQKLGSTLFLSPGMVAGRAEHSSWMNQGCGSGKYPGEAPLPCLHLCCVGPHLLTRTDLLSKPLGKRLIKLCNAPGRSAGDAPALQHLPEPALWQDLHTVPRDRGSCPAPPHSMWGDTVLHAPGQNPVLPASAGLRTQGSRLGCPSAPSSPRHGSSKAGQWGESLYKYYCCCYSP